jgi:hypothetical protein
MRVAALSLRRWPFRIVYLAAFAGATESAGCRMVYFETSAQVLLVPLLSLGLEPPGEKPDREHFVVLGHSLARYAKADSFASSHRPTRSRDEQIVHLQQRYCCRLARPPDRR